MRKTKILLVFLVLLTFVCFIPLQHPAYSAEIVAGQLQEESAFGTGGQQTVDETSFEEILSDFLSSDAVKKLVELVSSVDPCEQAGDAPRVYCYLAAATVPITVNFDDVDAPCFFVETLPLRGRHQGASFFAPGQDGGAILHECSEFGVPAFSFPNFLAFNNEAPYLAGGIAKLPELIIFPPFTTEVAMMVSGGAAPGFPMAIIALGPGGVQDVQVPTTAPFWEPVAVFGPDIRAVLLFGNPPLLVIDDITFAGF